MIHYPFILIAVGILAMALATAYSGLIAMEERREDILAKLANRSPLPGQLLIFLFGAMLLAAGLLVTYY
jgi:Mn2+/Fe2+ NRAMP family transporter